ncbi:MAG TPA: hypothetical protein VFC03_13160 [Acidimicrobiales bacterium]|jgi:hypothetical protein|nr:hypothetical protein [Acidimicrobiales bacterium]
MHLPIAAIVPHRMTTVGRWGAQARRRPDGPAPATIDPATATTDPTGIPIVRLFAATFPSAVPSRRWRRMYPPAS